MSEKELKGNKPEKNGFKKKDIIIVLSIAVIVLIAVAGMLSMKSSPGTVVFIKERLRAKYLELKFMYILPEKETRPTLSPDTFTDPDIKEAYQIAKDIPHVLGSIRCSCECYLDVDLMHKSLLTCFVDRHAIG